MDLVRLARVGVEGDEARREPCAIDGHLRHAARDAVRILDDNMNALMPRSDPRFESLPCGGNAWIDAESPGFLAQAEDGFDAEPP